jgi:Tol biopolymer transport system component
MGGCGGSQEPLLDKPGGYQFPRFSPDGERLAMSEVTGVVPNISVCDLQRERSIRLTFGEGIYQTPVWTPDGRYVSSAGKGLWWTRSNGAGQPHPLFQSPDTLLPSSFTSDGKLLAYNQMSGKPRIWTVPVEEDGRGLKAGKR